MRAEHNYMKKGIRSEMRPDNAVIRTYMYLTFSERIKLLFCGILRYDVDIDDCRKYRCLSSNGSEDDFEIFKRRFY